MVIPIFTKDSQGTTAGICGGTIDVHTEEEAADEGENRREAMEEAE
jgi:hypothetical protein